MFLFKPSSSKKPSPKIFNQLGYRRWRMFKDALAKHFVGIGGISVIVFIVLIFFYLAYVVLPLFKSAEAESIAEYMTPGQRGQTVHLSMEEQTEIGTRFTDNGDIIFFHAKDGQIINQKKIPVPDNVTVTSFSSADPVKAEFIYGLSNGNAFVIKQANEISYPNNIRTITPGIEYPLGEDAIKIDEQGSSLINIAFEDNATEATLVAVTDDARLELVHLTKEQSLLDESVSLQRTAVELPAPPHPIDFILIDKNQRHLYLAALNGELSQYDILDKNEPEFVEHIRLVPADRQIVNISFIAGDISLVVGDSAGRLVQWSLVRDSDNVERLKRFRHFDAFNGSITDIAPEYTRKGFLASDMKGRLGIFYTTSHRTLLLTQVSHSPLEHLAIAPRANAMFAEDMDGKIYFWRIENEYPEVSWSALWGKVWYESYEKPEFVWQSSSASDDFEPKFSLVPITFGTIKAAFYAMIIAIPLALMGAIYTAHFMAPRMRTKVKPTIEIMEALPTVILGFLAGLWLAPFVEHYLPGIFSVLILLPFGLLAAAYAWTRLPAFIRLRVPEGWEAAILLPVVAFIVWISFTISPFLETWFFGGDMRLWLTHSLGIGFDQRNSIVVGLAMGFAVIPTIFSIAEDAVFGVPKHLVQGSLALGATPWQTVVRVVLLTASPGIFSAIMIGLGRAVGETMIVLMATGNTPVMDFSPFAGLRTLSANIAVELPESEVNSTHFRVLFLAGMVLFIFTFLVNTAAELIRQRLRKKYSTL